MTRRVKDWAMYKEMEDRVQNMAIVLPLVSNLHSHAMRDRHWRQLIQVTKRPFEKGPSFCLHVSHTANALGNGILARPHQTDPFKLYD
jgi:hypothetical protein